MSNQNKILSLRKLDRVGLDLKTFAIQTNNPSLDYLNNIQPYIQNGLEYVSGLPFVHKRDNNGNIILIENEATNQKLLIEPNVVSYTNESVINALDTQFKFYVFPPNVIVQEPLDLTFDIDISQIETDRFEGRLLRTNRGYFYIQQNQARPFSLGAAGSFWLHKEGLPPFHKIDRQLSLDSDVNNLLDEYDLGENIYALYHNKSYEQVSNILVDSYNLGETFYANEALPTSRIFQIRVHINLKIDNGLPVEAVNSEAIFSFDTTGTNVAETNGIEFRPSVTIDRARSEGNNIYVIRDLFIDANRYQPGQIIPLRVQNLIVASKARNEEKEAPQIVQDMYSLISNVFGTFGGDNIVERFLDFYDKVFSKIESISEIAARIKIPVPDLTGAIQKVQDWIDEGRPSGLVGSVVKGLMDAALRLIGQSLEKVEDFIERINNFDLLEQLANSIGDTADNIRSRIEQAHSAAKNWLDNQFEFFYPELQFDINVGQTDLTYASKELSFNATDTTRLAAIETTDEVIANIPLDSLLDMLREKSSSRFAEDGLPKHGQAFFNENERLNIYIKKTSA